MGNNIITVVDLGTTKICTIIASITNNKIEIKGIGLHKSDGLEKGIIEDIPKATEAIKKTIIKAEEEAEGIKASNIYVGVAGEHIKSYDKKVEYLYSKNTSTDVKQEHIDKLIELAVDKVNKDIKNEEIVIIHKIAKNYTLDEDKNIKNPIKMSGKNLEAEVHIVTAKKNALENIRRCFTDLKYQIKSFVLEPLASSLAVLDDDSKKRGAIIVDIGGGTTDMLSYYNNYIDYSHIIEFGGKTLTKDLVDGTLISYEAAENIKINYGSLSEEAKTEIIELKNNYDNSNKKINIKTVNEILISRTRETIIRVQEKINSYVNIKGNVEKIVFTGGTSLLNNFSNFASNILKVNVQIGYPNLSYLEGTQKIDLNDPKYSTTVGLLYYGYREYKNNTLNKKSSNNSFSTNNFLDNLKNLFNLGE